MLIEGDYSVIEALKLKKGLLDVGEDASHINALCVVDGGLMKGAYATGAGIALEELGYTNIFNTVVGVSSGAPAAAYFVAGEVWKGSSLIYEECCSKDFINWRRFWSPLNPNVIIDAMKFGRKQLTWDSVKNSNTKLLIGVAESEDASPHLIYANNLKQLLDSVNASISIPTLTNMRVQLDGVYITDGGFSQPHILEHTLNSIDFTHAIVFTSQEKDESDIPLVEKVMNQTILRHRYSNSLVRAANGRRTARHKFIESKLQEKAPICFVWGDNSIDSNERNADKVKKVVNNWHKEWLELLS